jgi:hypothetical protein
MEKCKIGAIEPVVERSATAPLRTREKTQTRKKNPVFPKKI